MPLASGTGRARVALVASVLALATLVGCSDSGDNGGGATTTPPATTASATASSPSSPPASGRATITIDNFTFSPGTLKVSAGTRVTVTNKDSTTHTVTALTGKAFDTGDIEPGKTATFNVPAKAGTYAYHCSIHPFMKGTLTVS